MSDLHIYVCPNCNGRLEFDSEKQKLKCPFCESLYSFEEMSEAVDSKPDYEIVNEHYSDEDLEGVKVYTCDNCSGVIMAEETTAATTCPYCGNHVVLKGNIANDFKPSRVIPFKLDKKAAKKAFEEHLKGKKLLPKTFRSDATIDEIKGVYVPFWLFDGSGRAALRFKAEKHRFWSDERFEYEETETYYVYREGDLEFNEVPVDGSLNLDDALTQSIEPFDTAEAVDFHSGYLSGYLANKYDLDADKAVEIANRRILNSTSAAVFSTIVGYDHIVPYDGKMNVTNGKQEYVMFPVWILSVKYKGDIYTFAMNGQTGKFVGNLPADNSAAALHFLSAFMISTIILLALSYLFIMVL